MTLPDELLLQIRGIIKSGITLAKMGSAVVRSEHVPVALLEA